jgi:hypothetical protein
MKRSNKVIITCAVTGSIHTPNMSPHLPITRDEIAEQAIAAAEAGAAMLHLHARDPETGRPNQSPALFQRFLPRIKAVHGCDHQHHHRRRAGLSCSHEHECRKRYARSARTLAAEVQAAAIARVSP